MANPRTLSRAHRRLTESFDDYTDESDLLDDDEAIADPGDANFKSELAYEGYRDIQECDNDAFNTIPHDDDSTKELCFEGREESPDNSEESLIDPQENRK